MRRSSKKLTRFLRFALQQSNEVNEDSLHDILAQDRHTKRAAKRLENISRHESDESTVGLWEDFDFDDAERVGSWIDRQQFDGANLSEVGIRSAFEWMELTETQVGSGIHPERELKDALQKAIDSSFPANPPEPLCENLDPIIDYSLNVDDSRPTIRKDRLPIRESRRRRRGAIVGIGAVIAAIALGIFAYVLADLRNGVESKDNDNFSSNQPDEKEPIEVQPWESIEANNDSIEDSTLDPDQVPPDEIVVHPPQIDQTPPQPQLRETVEIEKFYWTQANGVVAIRRTQKDPWRLLVAGQSSLDSNQRGPFDLRSMGSGWASGHTSSGVELVVCDEVELTARLLPHEVWAASLSIRNGRASLQHLPAGAIVDFTYQGTEHSLKVHEDETVVAFDHSRDSSLFMLISGSVEHNNEIYSEPSEVRALQSGYAQRSIVSDPPWLTEPTRLPAVEKRIAEKLALVPEEDLIDGIFANVAALDPDEVAIVSEWTMTLDSSRTVPMALNARSMDQRRAAIAWLLNPATHRDEMRPVLIDLQASLVGSRCVVSRWIATARGEAPLSRRIIQNIQAGLSASEPLFVRELAIHLLRNLTGHAMPSYEPARPTRQAVTEVSRIVQAWLATRPEIN